MATFLARCKNEFRLKNFLLHQHHDEADAQTFVQFQFGAQTAYLIWRLFWAAFHMTWVFCFVAFPGRFAWQTRKHQEKWLIYLTDWSFLLLTLSVVLNFIVVCYVYFKRTDIREGKSTELTWYLKLAWCVVTMANSTAPSVTIAYWNLVYTGYALSIKSIVTHAVNTGYVIINVMFTGMPTKLFHAWFAVTFGFTHGLFSLVYYIAGGLNNDGKTYIYKSMDWANPFASMLVMFGVSVACILSHIGLFGIHLLKVQIFGKCGDRKEAMQITSAEVDDMDACRCADCDPYVQV